LSHMDEALRRAGHSAAVSLDPAPPPLSAIDGSDSSADLVEQVAELNEHVSEVSFGTRDVDDLPDPQAAGRSATSDSDIESEMNAMHAINQVLTGLPDADARGRVLRWAVESFAAGGLLPACCEQAATSGRLPANSMIHGFVADFQQLVREWHGCFDNVKAKPD
jgi:hypothetical protein